MKRLMWLPNKEKAELEIAEAEGYNAGWLGLGYANCYPANSSEHNRYKMGYDQGEDDANAMDTFSVDFGYGDEE